MRHKASVYKMEAEEEEGDLDTEGMKVDVENTTAVEQETSQIRRQERVRRLIEEEMVEAMEDDQQVAGMVLDSIGSLKQLLGPDKGEEILQTRIVSQAEVRRSMEEWRPSIEKELTSLFEKGSSQKSQRVRGQQAGGRRFGGGHS